MYHAAANDGDWDVAKQPGESVESALRLDDLDVAQLLAEDLAALEISNNDYSIGNYANFYIDPYSRPYSPLDASAGPAHQSGPLYSSFPNASFCYIFFFPSRTISSLPSIF